MVNFQDDCVLKSLPPIGREGRSMSTEAPPGYTEDQIEKGLKPGALGLVSATVMGVASTAPAYSLAVTLGLVVGFVGLHSPIVAILAFVPIFLTSIGYSELNKADPDCGTTFTWGTRAFGPKTGWAGGWAIVAADVLVMASLAQVAGQYVFLLFGDNGVGQNATAWQVLLVGIGWIVVMSYICYRGIEVSAWFQRILLTVEVVMLLVLSITALVRVETGHHPKGSVPPSFGWLLPTHLSLSAFISGIILMLFIYWGLDTAVSINEETKDKNKTPGQAAIISTVLLLITYALVIFSVQAFAGIGSTGVGLGNSTNQFDVLSVLGGAIFGGGGLGTFLSKLLILMVLTSASASTQTTILPTACTTLSMATYKAIPAAFARVHPRYLTPTVSTIVMGLISIALYIPFNYFAGGNNIGNAVTAIGLYIAFYYGLTAFSCVWYYRKTLFSSARNLIMRGILPLLGGLIMYAAGIYSLQSDWVATNSSTFWTVPGLHWQVGGIFIIAALAALLGLLAFTYMRLTAPAFFRKQILTRSTPTLVPEQ